MRYGVFCLVLAGCADPLPGTAVLVGGAHEVEAHFPDGTVARGWNAYEEAVARITPPAAELGSMPITVEDDLSTALGASSGTSPEGTQEVRLQIGKFAVAVEPDLRYVDGCIRKHILHLKLVLEHQRIAVGEYKIPVIELHFLAWLERNRPCVGVFNASFLGYGWCQKLCWTATREDVTRGITSGLIAAGATGTAAAIISRVLYPVLATALAF